MVDPKRLHAETAPRITLGWLWRKFWPLSLSDVVMAAGDPLQSVTLTRLPDPQLNLAAVACYYAPLALTMLLVWGGRAALVALAAWPAAGGFVVLVGNSTRMVEQLQLLGGYGPLVSAALPVHQLGSMAASAPATSRWISSAVSPSVTAMPASAARCRWRLRPRRMPKPWWAFCQAIRGNKDMLGGLGGEVLLSQFAQLAKRTGVHGPARANPLMIDGC